jgi:transcriptional regulator with XRE-family HTH domain
MTVNTSKRKTPQFPTPLAAAPVPLDVGFQPGRSHTERLEVQAFARRLHDLMMAKGLSQSDLARAIWGKAVDGRGYDVAKNRDRISQYLKGLSVPEPVNMAKIARELGVTVTDLAPDAVASAIDRENPAISMTMVAGHTDKTHLQINQLVPLDTAAKIIALLNEATAR